jgi:hypothetical protein
MRYHIFIFIVLFGLLCSCSQGTGKPKEQKESPSSTRAANERNLNDQQPYIIERGRYTGKNYAIAVRSVYQFENPLQYDSSYYCRNNFLYLMDKTGRTADSLALDGGCTNNVIIQDVSQLLEFRFPLFNISTQTGSDWYLNEFIGYRDGKLKKLFEIPQFNGAVILHRKDSHALSGIIKDSDELLGNFQNYPVTVSVDNFEVKIERPALQEIGFITEALENIKGSILLDDNVRRDYLIRKGYVILIDSLNRVDKTVRVIVNDTSVVSVPFNEIKGKVKGGDAG